RLPLGDPLTHREPMSHVARSRATPKLAAVNLGDEAEELTLDPRSLHMRLIDRIDQVHIAVCVCRGHRDLVGHGGGDALTVSNICSIVKRSRYLPHSILLHAGGPVSRDRCFEAGGRPPEVSDPKPPRCPPQWHP